MCCRFIIEKRSLRHCCVEGLSKVCVGLGIGERKGGGRGDFAAFQNGEAYCNRYLFFVVRVIKGQYGRISYRRTLVYKIMFV